MRILIIAYQMSDLGSVAQLLIGHEVTVATSFDEIELRVKEEKDKRYMQRLLAEGHLPTQPSIKDRSEWREYWKTHRAAAEAAMPPLPFEVVLVLYESSK